MELRVSPDDLGRFGAAPASYVRASTRAGRGMLVVAVADPTVAAGTAVLPFNLPEGGAGQLIDALSSFTELTLEKAEP